MNQTEQSHGLTKDSQISIKNFHSITVLRHNDVISENNGNVLTSANRVE